MEKQFIWLRTGKICWEMKAPQASDAASISSLFIFLFIQGHKFIQKSSKKDLVFFFVSNEKKIIQTSSAFL